MKKSSYIVTLLAAGTVTCTLGILAPADRVAAADRRPVDGTSPNYRYVPERSDPGRQSQGERPSQGNYHADYHADYRSKAPELSGPRTEDQARDAQPQQFRSRDSRDSEGVTRPLPAWRR